MKDFLFTFLVGFIVLTILGIFIHIYDVYFQHKNIEEKIGNVLATVFIICFIIGLTLFIGFITRELIGI